MAFDGNYGTNYSFNKQQLFTDIGLSTALIADGYSPRSFSRSAKLQAVAPAFWPFELTPLDKNFAYITDLLFKNNAKIPIGKFTGLFNPKKRFRASTATEFLAKLRQGTSELIDKRTYVFRTETIDGLMDPTHFEAIKPFFMNLGHLYFDSFFFLTWNLKNANHNQIVNTFSRYFSTAPEKELSAIADDTQTMINEWIERMQKELAKERKQQKDPKLENERRELERKLAQARANEPKDKNELIAAGELSFPKLHSDFENQLNGVAAAASNLRTTSKSRNLPKTEGYVEDIKKGLNVMSKYISSFENDLAKLSRNAENKSKERERAIQREQDDLERQLRNKQREIDENDRDNTQNTENIKAIIAELREESKNLPGIIKEAKRTLGTVRDQMINGTLLPINSSHVKIGLPIYVFLFADSKEDTGLRIPVLPQIVDMNSKGSIKTIVEKPHKNLLEDMFTYLNESKKRIEDVNKRCIQQNVLEYRGARKSIEESIDRLNNNGIVNNKVRKKAIDIIQESNN